MNSFGEKEKGIGCVRTKDHRKTTYNNLRYNIRIKNIRI